jgi:Zn-dependent metalloprotease
LALFLLAALVLPAVASPASPLGQSSPLGAASTQVWGLDQLIHARGLNTEPMDGPIEDAARRYLAQAAPELGLDRLGVDAASLVVDRVQTWRGRERIHLRQTHGGVPILGAGAVLQRDSSGQFTALSLSLQPRITADGAPSVDQAAAEAIARARAPSAPDVTGATLWIQPDGGAGRLVWRLHLRGSGTGTATRVTVDAHTGDVVGLQPDRVSADGRVFLRRAIEEELTIVALDDLAEEDDDDALTGTVVEVASQAWDGQDEIRVQHATPDNAGDFLFEPDHTLDDDGFAEVHTYFHVQQTRAYFRDTHGHPVPNKVTVTVNNTGSPGGDFDNAYFEYGLGSTYTLTFGQGADMDWSYDPGIVIHEFGHGVVDDVIDMMEHVTYPINMDENGLHPAPGGLTEGLPDYWSTTRNDRSTQAEFADGTPIRDSDNDATCPESIMGEAHQDGIVIGGTTWEIREALGAEVTDQLVYGAMGLLTSAPTYAEFGGTLVTAAEALADDGMLTDADVQTVQDIVDDRGLSDCGRSVPFDEETPATGTWLGADLFDASLCEFARNAGIHITPPFQYAFTIPSPPSGERVVALDLTIELNKLGLGTLGDDDVSYEVAVAQNELVRFNVEELEIAGLAFPLPKDPANAVWTADGSPSEARITAEALGLDALPPGETLTIALSGMNCATTSLEITASTVTEPVPATTNAGDNGGGCGNGCGDDGDASGGGSAAALLFPLMLLGVGRRRRSDEP